MRDPSYIRDHPQLGVAAKQRIYRFANEKGAVVNWLYRTSQWELFPVEFTGIEVTSFTVTGAKENPVDEAAVDVRLDAIEGAGTPPLTKEGYADPHAGETPEEKHARLLKEASNR